MDRFVELGFKKSNWIENKYGIAVFVGDNKNDWAYHIPKYLCKKKFSVEQMKYCNDGITCYMTTKEQAYQKVKEWTEFAEKHFGNK